MRRLLLSAVLSSLTLASPSLVSAHIQMNYPPTRTNMVQNQTTAPCGDLPRMSTPTAVQSGSTLNVQWQELIVHPGWYRISLATDANASFNILFDQIQSISGTTVYNQNVTLPTTACALCTLQLVQVNTSGTDTTTASGYIEYTACADLSVDPNAQPPSNTPVAGGTTTGEAGSTTGPSGGCAQGGAISPAIIAAMAVWSRLRRRRKT